MSDIILPQLGETVTEATITVWLKSVGDHVDADEAIAEVSTDKVDTEIVAPASGLLTEIRAPVGATAAVGDVIAVLGGETAHVAAAVAPVPPAATATLPASEPTETTTDRPAAAATTVPVPGAAADGADGGYLLLSHEVRRLLAERNLDPATITGTGAGGRITPADVRGATRPSAPTTPMRQDLEPVGQGTIDAHSTRTALSRIRLAIGRRMTDSLATSPHAISAVEIDYANVDRWRGPRRDGWRVTEGFSLTYLPFITQAVVDALRTYPHLNATIDGDSLVVHGSIHMGIAVDLDHEGLVVPVLRDADTKRLRTLARDINELATRARSRRLTADALTGGTFTITNNGSAGSVMSSAIINQPQVANVSTDAVVRRPAVHILPDGSEAIVIHPLGQLTMSWDHRAFDGAYAAAFLVEVKHILESRDWGQEM